jgi:hypothetical protein
MHALKASDLAAAMNDALKKVRIAPGDYAPQLTAPDGPSTAGGVQAMQHLRLVPAQPALPTIVVGHANHAAGTAELRTYDHVDALHRQRFQRSLVLDRVQYDLFLGFAKQLFDALHLQTAVVGVPADLVQEAPPEPARRAMSRVTLGAVVAAVLIAAAIAMWAVLARG